MKTRKILALLLALALCLSLLPVTALAAAKSPTLVKSIKIGAAAAITEFTEGSSDPATS